MNRRSFLKYTGGASLLMAGGMLPLLSKAQDESKDNIILTVLSTNDMHSRIDPFPVNDKKYAGMGGMANRASLIHAVRQEGNEVLVLDAGDIFQGTPYYNIYKGELELKLMNKLGYDASTLGNHEFDDGIENLNKQLPHAAFPFICSNYDLSQTPLQDKTIPYKIFEKGKLRVGIYGLGIEPKGLIARKNYGDLKYNDPIAVAREMEKKLLDKGCHLIIALSHLGYEYKSEKVSDIKVAKNTFSTDLIIGGHTHTFMDQANEIANQEGQNVIVSQSGWGGINLGRTDFLFEKKYMQKVEALNTTIFLKNQV
jgi:5'-nucleotidase